MRLHSSTRLAHGSSVLVFALLAASGARAATLSVYTDALQPGFEDWGWAVHSYSNPTPVRSGSFSASFEPDGFQGLYIRGGVTVGTYTALEFWIRGAGAGGQGVRLDFVDAGGSPIGPGYVIPPSSIASGAFTKVTVTFASVGIANGTGVSGFWFQDTTNTNQSAVYLDDIAFTGPDIPLTVAVDPSLDRKAVSPDIYGVNWGNGARNAQMRYPIVRWGGNPISRYNWQANADNRAFDYFFFNAVYANTPGGEADAFIDQTRAGGAQPFLSVPMLGRVARDRTNRYGFDIDKYGPQQYNECDLNPFAGCNVKMGNGCTPASTPGNCIHMTGNDPGDTSSAHDQTLVTGWMAHISTHLGGLTAANGGQKLYGLDNEPGLWHETHHDVWKPMTPPFMAYAPLGAVEHWNRTQTYAAAMKAQDPMAKILGPSDWLICTAYYTAADRCVPGGADFSNHGSKPFLRWYLQKAKDFETANGVRLVDYLDLHYYPQGGGIFSGAEDSGTSALRLRSIKSLYDPTYTDESWLSTVGSPGLARQAALPTLKSWIATEYPGTKLAIGEYNWGDGANGNGPSCALAQAEVLAIFAREGVDLATRWTAPAANTLVEDAFRLYMNYDSAGANVAGETCRATSSNVDAVGAYAQRGSAPTGPLYVLLFNKDTVDRSVPVTVAGLGAATANLYRFSQAAGPAGRLAGAGTASFVAGSATLALPARSATLAVLPLPATPPAGSKYYPLTPCRLLDTRNANGTFGGPAMGSGTSRSWTASAGACGIPADAKALSANLTVTQPGSAGELRAYPANVGSPVSSSISFRSGATRANNTMVGLSPAGAFSVEALIPSGPVHFILDVNGYFK